MKRTVISLILLALAALALIVPWPSTAHADPGTTITGPTSVTVGDILSVNVSGPVVIEQGGQTWVGRSTTGNCTSLLHGSYTNGGQKVTYTCVGADTLTAKATTATTYGLYGGDGQSYVVTVKPAPVVTPPPPPPAPVIAVSPLGQCLGTYTVTLTNSGTADWVGGIYSNSSCTPPNLAAVTLPAGATVTERRTCSRFRCYTGVGFTVRGLNIPVGASVAVSFVVSP
jgi:hypothetical protein